MSSQIAAEKLLVSVAVMRTAALGLCVFLAVVALLGILLGVDWLRNFTPWGTYIKLNPAICLLLLSIGIWMEGQGKYRGVARIFALAVGMLSLATLAEWIFGLDLGIDQLMFKETSIRNQIFPGRMPPNVCLCFLSLAASILLYDARKINYGQIFAATSFGLALLSVVGLCYGLNDFGMLGSTTLIAFPMAVALLLASMGALLTYPTVGPAGVFTSTTYGGLLARSIIPLSAVVPLIGAFSSGMGKWTYQDLLWLALFNAVVVPIIVWIVAVRVDRLDRDRQVAFEEAVKARTQAENANTAKDALLATVTHEVRSPLASVIGLNEIITLAELDKDTKALADLALESSKRLMHVLNDLLDYSRLEAGKLELEEREMEPGLIVGDAVAACRSQTLQKEIEVQSHIDPQIPKTVIGDQLRVSQIVLNFVSNAAKFTESGKISISAELITQDENSIVIRFSVKDTGVGISQETLAKLFQPFVQADASTSRRYGGSGLGLSISRNFAELMGGTATAVSEPGRGSEFRVDLPFKKSMREADG